MELLTGKAELFFNMWLIEYYLKNRQDYHQFSNESILRKHYRKTEVEKKALIIDFFDSIGIYIYIEPYFSSMNRILFKNYVLRNKDIDEQNDYLSRSYATEQAIIKANEIYNKQHE
jgi:hypothetical protein